MTSEPNPPALGTGAIAAANICRLRADQRFTYAALARELAAIGHSIPELGLRRLERGERRIDVDDLIAFARVFKVNPVSLLAAEPDDPAATGPPGITIQIALDGSDRLSLDLIKRFIQLETQRVNPGGGES